MGHVILVHQRFRADNGITHPRDLRDRGSTIGSLARAHAELVRIDQDKSRDAEAGEQFNSLLDRLLADTEPDPNGPAA